MRTWTYRQADKARWGEGPWDSEPDKIYWVSPTTDLDCLMHRGPLGVWCGYVGVPPEHPAHGVHYDHVDGIRVHGCLTYSALCQEEQAEGGGICHPREPGRPGPVWWLGFDCAHHGDLVPSTRGVLRELGFEDPPYEEFYRGLEYVGAETENLARQIVGWNILRSE